MKVTDQTMMEQMRIGKHEIRRRRELARLGDEEDALLSGCRPFIEEEIDAIVEEFYQVQTADKEIAQLIGDADTLRRLHATQRQYVLDLFSGQTDIDYVNNRLRIGLVHKRIGVEPKLYLSAVNVLKEILYKSLERRITDREQLATTRRALDRLLNFDVTLVFDTYTRSLLSEVQTARDRLEVYAASLEVQVSERTRQLEQKVHELESALALVKKLEGVIPICGVCKKIRDDKESWQQLEQYISEHSQALFSHGLCPDCYEKEMLELKALKETKRNNK
ncbi:MAG TPA: protoglobin domain-containing protein [Geomonas sp.]|nr:protoglobin domain-containing protein [Geomonas sp.]